MHRLVFGLCGFLFDYPFGITGDHQFFVGRDDQHPTGRPVGRDVHLFAGGVDILAFVDFDPHESEAVAGQGAYYGGVFTDSGGEDQDIESAQRSGIAADVFFQPVTVNVQRQLGIAIALPKTNSKEAGRSRTDRVGYFMSYDLAYDAGVSSNDTAHGTVAAIGMVHRLGIGRFVERTSPGHFFRTFYDGPLALDDRIR